MIPHSLHSFSLDIAHFPGFWPILFIVLFGNHPFSGVLAHSLHRSLWKSPIFRGFGPFSSSFSLGNHPFSRVLAHSLHRSLWKSPIFQGVGPFCSSFSLGNDPFSRVLAHSLHRSLWKSPTFLGFGPFSSSFSLEITHFPRFWPILFIVLFGNHPFSRVLAHSLHRSLWKSPTFQGFGPFSSSFSLEITHFPRFWPILFIVLFGNHPFSRVLAHSLTRVMPENGEGTARSNVSNTIHELQIMGGDFPPRQLGFNHSSVDPA